MKQHLDLYLTLLKTSIISQFQYRVAHLFWLLAMMVEPVVYLVVWGTIATSQGGNVAGYTAGTFAAYYITWTLVRQMNIALTPYAFENRIRKGRLSNELMRPIHPIHFDMSYFMSLKVVTIVLWLPIAGLLWWVFQPAFTFTAWWQIPAFMLALLGGFVTRFLCLWALGLVTFWVTKVSAVFELYFTIELLLSGRLVPLAIMPAWVRDISQWLPFQWTFGFPIDVAVGTLTGPQVAWGLAMQAVWMLIAGGILALVWPHAVRRYSAVGA
ncbi:ABC transporter permease [Herpetosiphon giganteus]|uniref:ABC transporter permease n=1 Tax=Herpetosiphon giganteus TaxID=2029754 RepID=UPI00195A0161|nr:ABC-2 family transporter protein [Herpetosiphon giganteus]MBM7842317.1 ABC-2 type transport system permease protein [Herpetosiphon giganteus]